MARRPKIWKVREITVLKELYPDASNKYLATRFKVTVGQIKGVAERNGFTKRTEPIDPDFDGIFQHIEAIRAELYTK